MRKNIMVLLCVTMFAVSLVVCGTIFAQVDAENVGENAEEAVQEAVQTGLRDSSKSPEELANPDVKWDDTGNPDDWIDETPNISKKNP